MPKPPRHAPGGIIFHCMNRGNARSRIFEDDGDYAAFERVLGENAEGGHPTLLRAERRRGTSHLIARETQKSAEKVPGIGSPTPQSNSSPPHQPKSSSPNSNPPTTPHAIGLTPCSLRPFVASEFVSVFSVPSVLRFSELSANFFIRPA